MQIQSVFLVSMQDLYTIRGIRILRFVFCAHKQRISNLNSKDFKLSKIIIKCSMPTDRSKICFSFVPAAETMKATVKAISSQLS